MAFSPFSQIVQPAPWVDPINLDLLRQANMYKEEIARQNLSNLSESFQALASTPAYGKDAEKLQEKMQELKTQISGLNLSDVSDYNTMGQIKGVINQVSSDKDILGIAQRGTKYNEWEKQIKDYQEKGKFVPAWKLKAYSDAQNYYNGKEFISDKRFSGTITPGFDWDKHNKTLVEETPEYHQLKKVGGNNELYQGKTYESLLGKFYEGLKQPGVYDDLNAQFEHFYGNEDYAKQDQQTALQQVNRLQGIIQNSNNPILIEKAKKDLDYWDDFANTVNPNTSKEDAFERFIKSNAEDFARTNTNYALKESKMSDAAKLEKDFIYDKALIQERERVSMIRTQQKQNLKAQLGNVKLDPTHRKLIESGIDNGYDVFKPGTTEYKSAKELMDMGIKIKSSTTQTEEKEEKKQVNEEYETEYKSWVENSKALDTYYQNKLKTPDETTTASYEVSVSTGEALTIQYLPQIVDYLKNKYPGYKEKFKGKNFTNIVWEDGGVYLDASGTTADADIKPEQIKEAIDHVKQKIKPVKPRTKEEILANPKEGDIYEEGGESIIFKNGEWKNIL